MSASIKQIIKIDAIELFKYFATCIIAVAICLIPTIHKRPCLVIKTITKTFLLFHSLKDPPIARLYFLIMLILCINFGISETEIAAVAVFFTRQLSFDHVCKNVALFFQAIF